jgi:hypothetical protein
MGDRNLYKDLFGKPEAKRLLGRLWYRWKATIEMEL